MVRRLSCTFCILVGLWLREVGSLKLFSLGPFWVATTAVLFLAATGNFARLFREFPT